MKKQFATFFIGFFLIQASLSAIGVELNASYDYFRGIPDGSWNGNSGIFFMANASAYVRENIGIQAGGSFGVYNWDGRSNEVFKNSKAVQLQSFFTAGCFSNWKCVNAGIVYDRLFTKHFGVFDTNPNIDQMRYQAGYQFCSEEVGFWGTAQLTTSHREVLGIPVEFRAINQINAFWSHFFCNCARTTVWLGAPFGNSLRYHHKRAGSFIAGFALRTPLANRLFIDGNGSYMHARHAHGGAQSKNYAANICIGLTYLFGEAESSYGVSYMPVANHSNFFVDTNTN